MPLTKLHPRDIQRIDWTVRTVEGAPIVHPNETRKRRGILATPFRRANVEGYKEPAYEAYVGHLVDTTGEPIGEEVELHIQRGVPDNESDVRYYWPRLIGRIPGGQEYKATGLVVVPVTETDGDDTVTRWYFAMGFGPWCEAEAIPGTVPRLPKFAPPADGMLPPSGVTPLQRLPGPIQGPDPEPADPAELEAWIERQVGGRPCGGCGEANAD